jgi:hypothetical protein
MQHFISELSLDDINQQYQMKKYILVLIATVSFIYCQKKTDPPVSAVQQANEKIIKGKWQFVYFTDSTRKTYTNADPCWADNTLELRDNNTAVISQGTCIEADKKPKNVEFSWKFIADDVVDMGSDTVKLTINSDTILQFHRINKSYLEYKWKRGI